MSAVGVVVPEVARRRELTVPKPLAHRIHDAGVWPVTLAGLVGGIYLWATHGASWLDAGLFAAGMIVSSLGITAGWHRLFSHKGYETTTAVKVALGIFGSSIGQGSLIKWVADHRRHHGHTDRASDPHSPYHYEGTGLATRVRNFWHAHMGWFHTETETTSLDFARDLTRDPWLVWVDRNYPLWLVGGPALCFAIGWAVGGTWTAALSAMCWGGLARMFVFNQITFCINSVCHLWGTRPYEAGGLATNHFVLGVLAMGEGWHNNHHAFPRSCRHGIDPGQPDGAYLLIRGLERLGLAWDLKLPPEDRARQ